MGQVTTVALDNPEANLLQPAIGQNSCIDVTRKSQTGQQRIPTESRKIHCNLCLLAEPDLDLDNMA